MSIYAWRAVFTVGAMALYTVGYVIGRKLYERTENNYETWRQRWH